MIVSLLFLFNYILALVKAKLNVKENDVHESDIATEDDVFRDFSFPGYTELTEANIFFNPPAYIQRYQAVYDVIKFYKNRWNIKKLVDFGCAELAFFIYIKQLEGIEEYIGVDIDKNLLQNCYVRALPLTADYLTKRTSPLKVKVLCGSVTDPDERLKDVNVVVAIELIEHMFPNELNDLPYNIFGRVQPELAIFTTPNSEFNVLFPNFSGFRHLDHKFEWTRQEFEDWGENITTRFPYSVTFHGIGKAPAGSEYLGCCSQMAIFVRNSPKVIFTDYNFSEIYEHIQEVDYPYETLEDQLQNTLQYEVYQNVRKIYQNDYFREEGQREVPVEDILKEINVDCSIDKLIEFLKIEHEVQYIKNKATLILPLDDPDERCDSSSCNQDSDNDLGDVNNKEDNIGTDVNDEVWDSGMTANTDDGEKKMNFDRDDLDWNSPAEATPMSGSDLLQETLEPTPSCSSNRCDSSDNRSHNIVHQKEKLNPCETDAKSTNKSTGAIPKLRPVLSNVHYSSTSVSSEEGEALGIVRSAGLIDIHSKSGIYSNNCSSTHYESTAEESFLERFDDFPSGKSPSKYPSVDIISINNIDRNSPDLRIESSKSSGVSIKSADKLSGKLLKCAKCSQSYLSRHVCLRIGSDKVPKIETDNKFLKNAGRTEVVESVGFGSTSSVHRSHSLGNVNIANGKCKNFRYSLNIDNNIIDCDTSVVDMDLEVCCKVSSVPSLSDTFGSHSKAGDSGYPNSVHDMDLDLTPEQVDEIITETESSLEDEDSSAEERVEQVQGNAPLVFLDNVENGDVANNNRDGEGNNMEGGEAAEVLNFEGLVMEGGDVEAEQHDSDDEGLYLSAIDVSNETLVPEESSSHDETLFNSVFEGPSSSSCTFRSLEGEQGPASEEMGSCNFPMWLLNILMNDMLREIGDSGIEVGSSVSHESDGTGSSFQMVNVEGNDENEMELTVPVDTLGGGDSTLNN